MPTDVPWVRFSTNGEVTNVQGVNVIPPGTYEPALAIIEGIDLIDRVLTEGHVCRMRVLQGGIGGADFVLFQAQTYATSQGYFAWRGAYPLFYADSLLFDAIIGEWDFFVWGRIEPAFGIQP